MHLKQRLALVVTVTVTVLLHHTPPLSVIGREVPDGIQKQKVFVVVSLSVLLAPLNIKMTSSLIPYPNHGWNGLKEGCLYTKQPFPEGTQSPVLT